jgi:hypothetical protein
LRLVEISGLRRSWISGGPERLQQRQMVRRRRRILRLRTVQVHPIQGFILLTMRRIHRSLWI